MNPKKPIPFESCLLWWFHVYLVSASIRDRKKTTIYYIIVYRIKYLRIDN